MRGATKVAAALLLAAAGIAVVAPLAPGLARAPQKREQAPAYYRMMLGDFELTALSDGTAGQPLDRMLENISSERLAALFAAGFQSMPYEFSINAFLVNTGNELVMIDAGLGTALDGKAGGRLIQNLVASGYRPEDVDAILLTHLHIDHVTGISSAGKRNFPNATVYVDAAELAFWTGPRAAEEAPADLRRLIPIAKEALAPYAAAGKIAPFEKDFELVPGVRALATPGHSPGHSVFSVASKGETVLFVGDLVHASEVQFANPSVAFRFDSDKDAATVQRKRVLETAASSRSWVAAAHLSFPGIGHVRAEGPAFAWVPAAYSLRRASRPK